MCEKNYLSQEEARHLCLFHYSRPRWNYQSQPFCSAYLRASCLRSLQLIQIAAQACNFAAKHFTAVFNSENVLLLYILCHPNQLWLLKQTLKNSWKHHRQFTISELTFPLCVQKMNTNKKLLLGGAVGTNLLIWQPAYILSYCKFSYFSVAVVGAAAAYLLWVNQKKQAKLVQKPLWFVEQDGKKDPHSQSNYTEFKLEHFHLNLRSVCSFFCYFFAKTFGHLMYT